MNEENKKIVTKEPVDVVNQFTGEKWYYSGIVKDHFFNPRNLMLEDPDESQYNATGMVGSPACLLPSTLVLANPSFRTIESVEKGETVFSHDSSYHPIEKIFRVEYSPITLVKIRNYLGEIVATADHLIYAKQIPQRSTFRHHPYKKIVPSSWVHAGDLKRGDIVLYPLPLEVRPVEFLTLSSERRKWDFKSSALPEKIRITSELLELFGYFIAEGYSKNTEIGFIFSDQEPHLAERVKQLVKNIFGLRTRIKERPEHHRIDVNVYNVHLTKRFQEWFGVSAVTKRIPDFILFLSPELQKGLLKGLWLGDGYFASWRSQPRAGFATVSPVLFNQLVFLLLRQRIIPSTFREKAKKVRGVNHRACFRIHVGDMESLERLAGLLGTKFRRDPKKRHEIRIWFEGNYACLPIKKVERIQFDGGRLFNFEVARTHTYVTDAFLVHNCGDMLKIWMKVDAETERIKELKWRTFGCASAIAATSMFSVMVTENGGMTIDDALKIKPQDIMARLGGLPNRKIHCSVLADKSFRKTVNDYFRKTGQHERVFVEGARIIDPKLNITDHDIEEAVLEGATDLDTVQRKLKVGVGSPEIIAEVEQLIRFYKEKYYG